MLTQLSRENRENNHDFLLSHSECIDQAEQIANVVISGLEKEEYSEINRQLSLLTHMEDDKEAYVFEHPKTTGSVILAGLFMMMTAFFIYFILIGLGTFVLSDSAVHLVLSVMAMVVSVVFVMFNYSLVKRLNSNIRFKIRYDIYREVLKFRNMEVVDDLAVYAKQDKYIVTKDLQEAIEKNLIPQGHFSSDNLVFMVSDKTYETYSHKQGIYDRYFKTYLDNRNRMKERTSEMIEILDKGNRYIEKIHTMETIIKDKNIKQKLSKIESIISMIFHEVDINPSQGRILGMLMNYYLPTTERLLETYISIDEKPVKGKSLTNTKKEIEEALDSIIYAYEEILEKIYKEYEIDITSDIAAMETILIQEGLSSNCRK